MKVLKQNVSQRTLRLAGTMALFGVLGAVVSGCGAAKTALGLEKSPPDEFAVVTKAPLIVPPDYSLRPPRPGAPQPQEVQPSDLARAALLGKELSGPGAPSDGEMALLMKSGAGRIDPNIRSVLDEEAGALRKKDEDFANKVLFSREGEGALPPESDAESMNSGDAQETMDEDEAPAVKKEGGGFFSKLKNIF